MAFSLTMCEDKETWDRFNVSSPQGNVFCSTPFLDALGEDYALWFVEEDNRPQLGAVVLQREGQPLRSPHVFTMYQGILFSECSRTMPQHRRVKWGLEVTEFLLTEMERRYDRISFCLHHGIEDLRSLQWFHYHEPKRGLFKVDLRYTALLDLSTIRDFDGYIATIRSVRRQEYRKALTERLLVEESNDLEELNRLHRLTFERQGIERSSEEERWLLAISQAALSQGFGRLALCRDSHGVAVSATLFLYDNRCGYYLFAANDPACRKIGSGAYLMVENLRWCWERGLDTVDFVGINSPNRGDFKTSFNARPVPYFVVDWESTSC